MILEEIKSKVDQLTPEERHQLSIYLTKLNLQEDEEFWKDVRKTSEDKDPSHWVNIEDIK